VTENKRIGHEGHPRSGQRSKSFQTISGSEWGGAGDSGG